MKKYILQLLVVLFVSSPLFVNAQTVVKTEYNDATVRNNAGVYSVAPWGGSATLDIGGGANGTDDYCAVIPFYLPDNFGQLVNNVSFDIELNVLDKIDGDYGGGPSITDPYVDVYGLSARSVSTVLDGDFYMGEYGLDNTDAFAIQENFISVSTTVGRVTTSISGNEKLKEFIQSQYDAGNGGKYIFIRLSPNKHFQNYQKANLYGHEGASADLDKVAKLTIDFQVSNSPTFNAPIADQTVDEVTSTPINFSVADPNGDALSISYTNLPSFATTSFTDNGDGTGDGTITLDPLSGDAGNYNNVTVTVDDGNGNSSDETFGVTVVDPNTFEITAPTADGYVSDPAIIVTNNPYIIVADMKLGKSAVDGSANTTSVIIPFQLPARQVNYEVKSASLNVYVSYGREHINANVDLYGLPFNASSTINSLDHYAGAYATSQGARGAVGIEDDYFTKNIALGSLDTPRWEETTIGNTTFEDYINAQYDAGAVAGDWVFFRLSMDDDAMTGAQYFKVDGGEGTNPATLSLVFGEIVEPTFDAPIADQTVNVSTSTDVNFSATDPNSDPITFSIVSAPSFVSITDNSNGTGFVTIAPLVADEGVYNNVIIRVSDDNGNHSDESFNITVIDPDKYVIIASTDDGYVVSPAVPSYDPQIVAHMMVGTVETASSPQVTSSTSAIIPFQLPLRVNATDRVSGAKFKMYVAHGREWSEDDIDLYGLKFVSGSSSSSISENDWYVGSFTSGSGAGNLDPLEYGIEKGIISKNNPLGIVDVARYVETTNQAVLINYINAQYNNGAVDGDWIFLRLSLENEPVTRFQRFNIDASDGESVQDYNEEVTRSDTHKPELYLHFTSLIPTTVTTWNGTTWDKGVPTSQIEAIIDGDINIGGANSDINNIFVDNITVNNGVTISVFSGSNLVVKSNIDIQIGGTVIINSGGSMKIEDGGTATINGTYTVERIANQSTHNYTYWSSPVDATVETALIATGSPKVYKYITANFNDADDDGEDDDRNDWQIATGAMVAGKGYIAKSSGDEVATTQTAVFTAVSSINKGEVLIPMSLSADASGDADNESDDWNLIGNPYSTGIWAKDFINHNSSVMYGTLYFWTHNTAIDVGGYYSGDDYANYNLSGGTVATSGGSMPWGDITSGQGFFVEALSADNISFLPSMQILSVDDTLNNNFFKKGVELSDDNLLIEDRIWFNVENDDSFSQILVGFFDEATNGLDNLYDGKRLDVGNNISFYSIAENQQLAIQGRSSFVGNETVVLGFNANVSSETTFNISIERIEGLILDSNISVILKDKDFGVSHNLKSSDYPFTVETSGTYNDRFEIVFTSGTLANNTEILDSSIHIYPNPTTNYFSLDLESVDKVLLFNTSGIKVFESTQEEYYNVSSLPKGVYLVKVITINNTIITSKLVKN